MSEVANESLQVCPFTEAVKSWQQYAALLKRSGKLLGEAESLRRDSLDHLIQTSRLLSEAFDNQERYGDWGRLWKDEKHPPPFSKSKADRLRAIWKNPTLQVSANWRKLPADASLVEDLATVPADKLQAAINDGRVRPTMTGKEVIAVRDGSPAPREVTFEERLRRALRGVARKFPTKPPAEVVHRIIAEVWPEDAEAPVRVVAA